MPLTMEQYATWLDTRDLPWPSPPEVERPKARPHLKKMPEVRAVCWNVYGTLISLPGGELYFEHPQEMIMNIALDKTIQEFKMWGSMSRKPGQPSAYMKQMYDQVFSDLKGITVGGEKHPEVASHKIWEGILKKLLQKEYTFDAGFYGSLNQLAEKIAYFFHASLQGTGCYPGAAQTIKALEESGKIQYLLAEGQCFTAVQLQRGLQAQQEDMRLESCVPEERQILSFQVGARKPSERIYRQALEKLSDQGIESHEVLHIGSRIEQDIEPGRRLGMRTALFAGDKASLRATPEQLKDSKCRPDALITELPQVLDLLR